MHDLLGLLVDLLGYSAGGSRSKSKVMRWFNRIFLAALVALIALVFYRLYG